MENKPPLEFIMVKCKKEGIKTFEEEQLYERIIIFHAQRRVWKWK